jgi:hydroxymethylglutaryl-CoA reductase
MKINGVISGFSKLTKEEKLSVVAGFYHDRDTLIRELSSFWHENPEKQRLFEEFSENTITNYFFPYGIAPNMRINGKDYLVPMVIEESSVVAAASSAAKFWAGKGGFHAEVISTEKIGQVHFIWEGDVNKLKDQMPILKERLIKETEHITRNMRRRGGGILDIELIDMTHEIDNYYQLKGSFDTVDSMGANFINSCLEEFALILRKHLDETEIFEGKEKECDIIMSILSNYTPECLVKTWVECPVEDFNDSDNNMSGEKFVWKFQKAVEIAQKDKFRAATHNKGIFNGVDAVVLATGNDFRAVEAAGHTYASRSGRYTSLTNIEVKNGMFRYELELPLALGTVGGLTKLHPLAKISLELLGNPDAKELMMIAASVGLANNYGALKSLTTKGIQVGHMKMHLFNILNFFHASKAEKEKAVKYFKDKKVSFNSVSDFIQDLRSNSLTGIKI